MALTSKSTKGCRLRATDPIVIGATKTTGLTSGLVDLSKVPGSQRGRTPNGLGPAPELGFTTPKRGKIHRPKRARKTTALQRHGWK